jgi:hypothetical protein
MQSLDYFDSKGLEKLDRALKDEVDADGEPTSEFEKKDRRLQ